MRKFAMAALLLGPLVSLTAVPARAQGGGMGGGGESKTPMQIIEEGEKNDRAEVDKQYQRTRRHEQGAPVSTTKRDPWAGARSTDIGKAPAKDAAKDTKKQPKEAKRKPGAPMPLR
ncbi:MAG: hypothetical protein AB7K64_15325 [Variibacter sp.]